MLYSPTPPPHTPACTFNPATSQHPLFLPFLTIMTKYSEFISYFRISHF